MHNGITLNVYTNQTLAKMPKRFLLESLGVDHFSILYFDITQDI